MVLEFPEYMSHTHGSHDPTELAGIQRLRTPPRALTHALDQKSQVITSPGRTPGGMTRNPMSTCTRVNYRFTVASRVAVRGYTHDFSSEYLRGKSTPLAHSLVGGGRSA